MARRTENPSFETKTHVAPIKAALMLAALCIGVFVVAQVISPPTRAETSPPGRDRTPGFDDQAITPTTTPFEVARANTQGPTTIPDGFKDFVATTTSTTIVPLAQVPASDPVCLAAQQLTDMYRISITSGTNQEVLKNTAIDRISRANQILRRANNGTYRVAIEFFDGVLQQLYTASTLEQVGTIINTIADPNGLGPRPEVAAAMQSLFGHVQNTCPQIMAQM